MINEIKGLSIESKSNGIILIISMDNLSPKNSVNAWQATSGWFYLTIFAVKADSSNIKTDHIPAQIQNFQIIDNKGSVQISLKIKEPIHDYNFIYDLEKKVIISNLHYSTEYFAKIDDIKKINQPDIIKILEKKYSNWFYKTGLALTLLGLIDNPESINNASKIGIGILILTGLYDLTFKKFY
jgi:hypothetical protein